MEAPRKPSRPWLFGLTVIPFGISMFCETWRTAQSRSDWTGILFCLSPVAPNYQVGGGTGS